VSQSEQDQDVERALPRLGMRNRPHTSDTRIQYSQPHWHKHQARLKNVIREQIPLFAAALTPYRQEVLAEIASVTCLRPPYAMQTWRSLMPPQAPDVLRFGLKGCPSGQLPPSGSEYTALCLPQPQDKGLTVQRQRVHLCRTPPTHSTITQSLLLRPNTSGHTSPPPWPAAPQRLPGVVARAT